MAVNPALDRRQFERRLFLFLAILFPVVVVAGFARTYYLRFFFDAPLIPTLLVHMHGVVMTAWVALFITQVWLISSKRIRVHQKLGFVGIGLAVLLIVVGFFTASAGAVRGSAAAPQNIPPLVFFVVPFFDLVMFAIFFGGAIYFRKQPANHKRLMVLTVLNFLPPAIARLPGGMTEAIGPLWFFGIPGVLALILVIVDTWRTGKLNKVFLVGAVLLIASYPLRLMVGGTDTWMRFATWVTS
jgi:hypothetical protein